MHPSDPEMRRLENEDEEKFWEAWIKDELIFCYRYGKIGAQGHTKLKKFKTRAEAEAELEAKLAEKLEEGFVDPTAEDEEDEAEDEEEAEDEAADDEAEDDDAEGSEDESDEADESNEDESAEEEEDAEGDTDEDESDDDSDDDGESDEEDASEDDGESDESDESDEADDSEDESDSDDEDGAPKRRGRAISAPEMEELPPKPTLPVRVRSRAASPEAVASAVTALGSLVAGIGTRSWKVARLARRARRALERLGGNALAELLEVSKAFDAVMDLVIAPKKRLSLEDALTLLWVVDGETFARTVSRWRAKMLDSPAVPSIGVLHQVFEAIADREVAVHFGTALVNRRLSPSASRAWFARLRPFVEEALGDRTLESIRATLRPGNDPVLKSRLGEVTS